MKPSAKKRGFVRTLWVLLFLLIYGYGAPSAALDQREILLSVDKNFPSIIAAHLQIEKAEADLLSAHGRFDPKVSSQLIGSPNGPYQNIYSDTKLNVPFEDSGNSAFAGYRVGLGDFPNYDQGKWTLSGGETYAGIEMPLVRDRKIDSNRAKLQSSKISVAISQELLKQQKLMTSKDALFVYWNWVAEGKKLLNQEKILSLAIKRQAIIDQRVSKGDAAEIESIENQRIILRRQADLQLQARQFQKASFLLSLYYRDCKGHPLIPTLRQLPKTFGDKLGADELISMEDETAEKLINTHPAVRQLTEERKLNYVNLDLANNELKPKLNNKVYLAQDYGDGAAPINRTTINYQLVFEIPLFQREAKGMIAASRKQLQKIDAEQKLTQDKLMVGILDAKNQLQITKKVAQLANEEVGLASRVAKAENTKFLAGDSNLFLVNSQETAELTAKNNAIDAMANYYKAKVELAFACGVLSPSTSLL